jgi:hypothetical protein
MSDIKISFVLILLAMLQPYDCVGAGIEKKLSFEKTTVQT